MRPESEIDRAVVQWRDRMRQLILAHATGNLGFIIELNQGDVRRMKRQEEIQI